MDALLDPGLRAMTIRKPKVVIHLLENPLKEYFELTAYFRTDNPLYFYISKRLIIISKRSK